MDRRCVLIRDEAEKVIEAFRAYASRIASGDSGAPLAVSATTLPATPVEATPGPPVAVPVEPSVPSFVMPVAYTVTDEAAAAENMRA